MVPETSTIIENELQVEGSLKFALILNAQLEKPAQNGDTITTDPFFHSGAAELVLHIVKIQGRVHGAVNKIMKRLEGFTNEGSG